MILTGSIISEKELFILKLEGTNNTYIHLHSTEEFPTIKVDKNGVVWQGNKFLHFNTGVHGAELFTKTHAEYIKNQIGGIEIIDIRNLSLLNN